MNMILLKNQSLWVLLLEEQSLVLFLLDPIHLEVSLGLPFLHCRPAKRLKQDGKDVHCINYNCHKKNNKLRDDLMPFWQMIAFYKFSSCAFDNEIVGK